MSILFSLLTAGLYGAADFCGGLASARARVVYVLFVAHAIGLVGVGLLALLIADGFAWDDMGLGALGGLAGVLGVGLLYRRLALGPMHIVAPLSAVMSAVVPAFWGLVSGEKLSAWSWLGVGLALVAIALVSVGQQRSTTPVTARVVGESLLSGVGFGAFFVFLDATSASSSPWPVVGARLTTVPILLVAAYLVARSKPQTDSTGGDSTAGDSTAEDRARLGALGLAGWSPRLWALVAFAGLGDAGANATFLFASETGDLAVVSVLSSLYPVSTVVLARVVLGDLMTKRQFVGFAIAITGTLLIIGG